MKRILITLFDIGYIRLGRRIKYELILIIEKMIPTAIIKKVIGITKKQPLWIKGYYLNSLPSLEKCKAGKHKVYSIRFNFLNEERILNSPINWNNSEWSRLWKFNLHYFDWMRIWIEQSIISNNLVDELNYLDSLIDSWIEFNTPGKGDGWHSYTISIRARNLIYLYRLFPELISQKRLGSLWLQLCWLNSHLENHHGGNHYLENLITLTVGGLQFSGSKSSKILSFSLKELEKELNSQILSDGGHEERSSSYHLIILDRLIELGFLLIIHKNIKPDWLIETIYKMTNWVRLIKLQGDNCPRYNDSPENGRPHPKIVLQFASSYLNQSNFEGNGIRKILSDSASKRYLYILGKSNKKTNYIDLKPNKLTKLQETGWTIIRPDNKWELTFKCGIPCPKHLPAHAHSDQLSFDLFYSGKPVLAETGTSLYGNSLDRHYERGCSAHNIMQFAITPKHKKHKLNWIQPVEVWGGFRAGRKSNPKKHIVGFNNDKEYWVIGAHDAYDIYGFYHERKILITLISDDKILFTLKDSITSEVHLSWRLWLHLGPNINKDLLHNSITNLEKDSLVKHKWIKTWYSFGFGDRLSRDSLCLEGLIPKGDYNLCMDIPIDIKSLKL